MKRLALPLPLLLSLTTIRRLLRRSEVVMEQMHVHRLLQMRMIHQTRRIATRADAEKTVRVEIKTWILLPELECVLLLLLPAVKTMPRSIHLALLQQYRRWHTLLKRGHRRRRRHLCRHHLCRHRRQRRRRPRRRRLLPLFLLLLQTMVNEKVLQHYIELRCI